VIARFFAWTAFAAAFLFVGGFTVFGAPVVPANASAAMWQTCATAQNCPLSR
jgi:hypothetical protein